MTRRFVVLDRDGTLVEERHYLSDPEDLVLLPGAARALRSLARAGLGLVVVTNQSAVGRGYFDRARLEEIHGRLKELLAAEGASLDGIYSCPHVPEERCACRKPETGLLETAAREHGFEVAESFVVGDQACDVELGRRVGARTILVRTGYGAEVARAGGPLPDYVAADLTEAARRILQIVSSESETASADLAREET
jgi:D-glycero-D-manno-heptose 1,7-bisphosphate phosphatase